MNIVPRLRGLDWKFLFTTFVALIFGLSTLYLALRSNTPKIDAQVVEAMNALDVREQVPNLRVFIGDIDLFSKSLNLAVESVRFSNSGSADLAAARFDPQNPIGILVKRGNIIDVKLASGTSEYIKKNVRFSFTPHALTLQPFYFAKDQSFVIKLFVLHPSKSPPHLSAIGDLAGMGPFKLTAFVPQHSEIGIFGGLLYGGFIDFIVRILIGAVITALLFFVFLATIVVPSLELGEVFRKRQRRSTVLRYRSDFGGLPSELEFLEHSFIVENSKDFLICKEILREIWHLRKLDHLASIWSADEIEALPVAHTDSHRFYVQDMLLNRAVQLYLDLDNRNIIARDALEPRILIGHARTSLEKFTDYLLKNGLLSNGQVREVRRGLHRSLMRVKLPKVKIAQEVPTSRQLTFSEATLDAVRQLLPAQPWPRGTHRQVRQRLGLSGTQYQRIVDELIRRGDFKLQRDGQLFEPSQLDE